MENRLLFARHVKNNRPQPLPLCSDMVAILQEYLTYREGKAHEPLFPSDADQQKYIDNSEPGEGLLIFENVVLPFSNPIPKNTQLYKIMTTRLNEVVEL